MKMQSRTVANILNKRLLGTSTFFVAWYEIILTPVKLFGEV